MNLKPFLLPSVALLVVAGALLPSHRSSGQAEAEAQTFQTLLTEITSQQTVIAENQLKIDERLAAIAEELRIARIYVARGGGRGGAK